MKQNILFASLFVLVLSACKQSNHQAIFYDEGNYNTVKEIKSHNNRLYILGQHFAKNGSIELTTSFLCIDTSLYRRWDIHLGDIHDKEWFESFCIDANGNMYLAGYNGKTNKAELMKFNAKGQVVFKKDYPAFTAFKNIVLLQDTSVVVTAIKHFANTAVLQDSAFIQKLNGEGDTSWQRPIGRCMGPGFLKTASNNITFLNEGGLNEGTLEYSELFCIDSLGNIQWHHQLTNEITGFRNGPRAVNLKIDNDTAIYTLCESYDGHSMTLVKFNMNGEQGGVYKADLMALENNQVNLKDNNLPLLFTGLNLGVPGKEPVQLIVRKDKQNTPYFTTMAASNQLVDFIKFNNSLYEIANTGDLPKHYSAWEVIKE